MSEVEKRRMLLILTVISVAIILVVWVVYVNWTFKSPAEDAPPTASVWDIFKTGLSVIGETIETGFTNSYAFFHQAFLEEKTIMITP